MKINILILILVIATTGVWTYFSDTYSNTQKTTQEKVKDFNFKTLSGESNALYDYKGEVILLHFWATWCAPCIEELPKLIELAQTKPNKLTIIALAVSDEKSHIQRFLSKINKPQPNNFIIGLDPDKIISKDMYNTIKLPETYVINPNLILIEKVMGAENRWNNDYWKDNIDRLQSLF